MPDAQDMDLVREFVRHNSEAAFTELVRRHIALVYSVARRCTGNDDDAQDVTQAVFIILARKAAGLRERTLLPGWLYETTRFTAARLLRTNARRQQREHEAYMQSTLNEANTADVWEKLSPHLEAAMSKLAERDRALLVLRFYQNKSGPEAAALMGIREDAAQKRVRRAIEKLRKFFTKRGVDSTAATIAETISANSVQAAPMALAKTVTAVAIAKGATASISTLTLIKGVMKIMAWTKAKTAIVASVGILLVAGTGTVVVEDHFFPKEPSYQGRSLSEWLVDVGNTHYYNAPGKALKAAEAIRKMGGKTLPFLLADLGDARYKRYSRMQDKRTPDQRNSQATWAFDALGSIGKPAIPELTRILEQNPGYVPGALAGIGRDALPELLDALTNEDFFVRDNTAAYLANAIYDGKITPAEAEAAFPIAINNLTYTSTNELFRENTRWRAAGLLGALGLHPDVAVPALIQGMDNTNPNVAAECAVSLGKFGPDAAPAVPKMIEGINGSNLLFSVQCAMSLGEVSYAGLGTNTPAAISALNNAANSTNNTLSLIAKGALEQLGRRH